MLRSLCIYLLGMQAYCHGGGGGRGGGSYLCDGRNMRHFATIYTLYRWSRYHFNIPLTLAIGVTTWLLLNMVMFVRTLGSYVCHN